MVKITREQRVANGIRILHTPTSKVISHSLPANLFKLQVWSHLQQEWVTEGVYDSLNSAKKDARFWIEPDGYTHS
jgi:hypothetical protein